MQERSALLKSTRAVNDKRVSCYSFSCSWGTGKKPNRSCVCNFSSNKLHKCVDSDMQRKSVQIIHAELKFGEL